MGILLAISVIFIMGFNRYDVFCQDNHGMIFLGQWPVILTNNNIGFSVTNDHRVLPGSSVIRMGFQRIMGM